MEWKDLLAADVLKVDQVDDQRADWMTRATLLLAGEFNLSELMVAAGLNSDSGSGPTKYAKEVDEGSNIPPQDIISMARKLNVGRRIRNTDQGQCLRTRVSKKEPSWSCFALVVLGDVDTSGLRPNNARCRPLVGTPRLRFSIQHY